MEFYWGLQFRKYCVDGVNLSFGICPARKRGLGKCTPMRDMTTVYFNNMTTVYFNIDYTQNQELGIIKYLEAAVEVFSRAE